MAPQSQRKGSQEGRQSPEEAHWRQEKEEEEARDLLSLHLQVLKQVHPDTGISSKAMSIMNSFVNDISRESPVKLQNWPTTTSDQPSLAGRSKPQSDCCCPESWPSMLSVREPRPSPSTPAPSRRPASATSCSEQHQTGPF